MKITIEQSGQVHTMEVSSFGKNGLPGAALPEGVTGLRRFNMVCLKDQHFNRFIDALMVDDFEAIRNIMVAVIDTHTKELPFKHVDKVQLLNNDREESYF